MEQNYYLELIRGTPIDYHGLIFYPISFGYICEHIGLEAFDKMMMPYCITRESLDIPDEERKTLNLFEDIILKDEVLLLQTALALRLFCKCDNILREDNVLHLYDDDHTYIVMTIDKDNFDDISTILLKLAGKKKIKVTRPPKNMTEKQQDIWNKLHSGRAREAARNEVHIYDVLNICEFGGSYRIPLEEIETWTLFRIMNCYKARINMKAYDDNLKICLVTHNDKSISGDHHWQRQLLVRE